MIIQKNKRYDPSTNRLICHFQWEIEMNRESAKKVCEGGHDRLIEEVNIWCVNNFGQMAIDDWAASTLPIGLSDKRQVVFYFKKKDDAILFKLTWD